MAAKLAAFAAKGHLEPAMDMLTTPKKRDRTGENFTRAVFRGMQRFDKISRHYEADVYIIVRRKHRHYDFNSSNDPSFPPSAAELVRAASFHVEF